MVSGHCARVQPNGQACRAFPITDSRFCFWHDPAKVEEVAEAQRLGGLRRRKERHLSIAYDFTGLGTIESIRRLLEIAATDVLGLELNVAKVRATVAVAQAAAKLLETGEFADRLSAIEGVLEAQRRTEPEPEDI